MKVNEYTFWYFNMYFLKIWDVCVCVCVCVYAHTQEWFDSLWPRGLQPTRLLCPWNFPGKNTGVGCHFLSHRMFPTQGSNLSILKEISPEYSLEGLMPKLKLQYFGHWCKELTHWKRPWCWERLRAEEEGDNRGWDSWMTSPTQWTWVWVGFGSWCWTGRPGMLRFMGLQRVGHDWVTELNWSLNFGFTNPVKYFWVNLVFPNLVGSIMTS